MRITVLFLFLSSTIFFSSCSKLPVYKSKVYAEPTSEGISDELTFNYDNKNNMNFEVSNDETNLYLVAVFYDSKSYQKIMRGGLNIYFDPTGKKKKHYKLEIERSEKQENMSSMSRDMRMQPGNSQTNLPAVIQAGLTKVTWDKNGDEFVFYRNLLKEPIGVELGPNKSNELVLEVKMPLNELPLENGQKLITLGIESGPVSSPGMGGQRPGGGMGGGKGGGGGHGGGGGGGGGGRGGMQGGGEMQGGTPSGMEPIKLWFQVQL